ncbi:50S ribosomal protein L23 [archaeon]|nr:50S ribosomal protein L23 [archaeon]|tara:strand:+ start:8439 stop:8735 length:297 start_codon:yes stop_codon:yes gene_type:complete
MRYEHKTRKIESEKDRTILIAPLATEKCIRQIEADNVLCFVVTNKANKQDVKKAVENEFKVKVSRVNIQNSVDGRKKAYVRLAPGHLAADVSADLGFI